MGLNIGCKCGSTSFSMGSYSLYGWWREKLARLAGIKNIYVFWKKSGSIENRKGKEPFFEILNFSDCEGILPYRECKRLLEDFDKFAPIVHGENKDTIFWFRLFDMDIVDEDWDYWVRKFDSFHKAVRHAVEDKCNIRFC